MRKALTRGAALLAAPLAVALCAGASSPARAAVTDSQFPPKTVADLIAICSAGKDDPRMTASVNYCSGFVEGAVIVEMAHAKQRGGRALFCLPTPSPETDTELANFTNWANQDPKRLQQPAIDGMFVYLGTHYPCSPATAKKKK
ncbi:MAG: hypothetical protein BGO51_22940 [Rhodospirillales bacterium 69-11]|nr:hypothetical protein [Rhodospirillales bacterium]OJW31363.1 MAG: hypothetical protein BGO51_22940 [Rhodospirillales bacterium 69-11]